MSADLTVKLVWAAIVVAAAAIGYVLVDAALLVARGTGQAPIALTAAPTTTSAPAAAPGTDVDLARLNLFGNPQAAPEIATEVAEAAPETRLKITLIGVFVADNNADSAAIIASNRSEQIYRVGDSLPGNATLAEVQTTHVLLKRAGGHERLSFEEPDAALARSDTGAGTAARAVGGVRRDNFEPQAGDDSDLADAAANASPDLGAATSTAAAAAERRAAARARQAAATEGIQNAREFLDAYGERLTTAPSETLAELGIQVVESGTAAGYRLADVASPAELSKVGLRRGDVVLSVNGQQLGNTQVDSALVEQVSSAGAARLEIQRGQRRFFVTLSIPKQ